MTGQASRETGAGRRLWVLFVLILVYTFNFIDRQIVGILAPAIKADLALTDAQLGMMGGLAFALLYSTLGLPIAWLADRFSRTWIMTLALAAWSAFTALCGTAASFPQLFLYRMGVGVGEAGGVAPAYSLIADYFPARQRARALAAFSFGIPIGTALGVLFGGLIAVHVDWRAAFLAVGVAGVVLAPLLRLTVRDPERGGQDRPATEAAAAPAKTPGFFRVVGTLLRKRSFWLLSFGAASASTCGYGVAFWLPSFFVRSWKLSLIDTTWFYSGISFFGGVLGIALGGWLADRLGAKRKGAYPLVPAVCFLISLPCFVAAVNAPSLTAAFFMFLIPTGLNLAWLGPVITSVQHLVSASMRSTASAAFLLINNLVGIGLGTWYFGAVSDALKPQFGAESIRYAIYSGLGFYLLAALLLILASRSLKKDWVD
jgi:predicted MFS family arabinose efflux permease